MKIFNNFDIPKNIKGSILLIGNFDGVHLGHKKLFKEAQEYKKKYKLKIGVLTFEPMPKMFFNKKLKNFRISSLKQKNELMKNLKIDFLINKKFDKNFSSTNSINFIKNIISKKLKTKFIFVSDNFRFGKNREGDVKQLKNFESELNYQLVKPKPVKINDRIVSSTLIRKSLENGKLDFANKLLDRKWVVDGKVEKGRQLGRKIGFPTCNIDIKDFLIPRLGVYAVNVFLKGKIYKGIANIGYRPTFNQKKLLLEVHLFNFSGNLYNKYLRVNFLKFIRKEKKFTNIEKLQKQIKIDLAKAKKNYV
jgi:riboflavin kinase / FMN adenylyltransferase